MDRELRDRVCKEYGELPGLQLTLRQASRLWTTEMSVSEQVLDELVRTSFLHRIGTRYVRTGFSPLMWEA